MNTGTMEHIRFDTEKREGDTIGDFAYRQIRSHIVNGQLAPDEKLKLSHFKDVYGTSVTTLREILNRLAVEELVTAEGQRGFRVAPVSNGELRDLGDLRTLLESHALRRSIRLGDLDWEASVVAAHHKLSVLEAKLLENRDAAVDQWVACDWGFHNATISACRQPVLMRSYASVFDRFARYHMLALNFRGEGVLRDHAQLKDLVIARRADEAVDLLTRHILSGVEHIQSCGGFG